MILLTKGRFSGLSLMTAQIPLILLLRRARSFSASFGEK